MKKQIDEAIDPDMVEAAREIEVDEDRVKKADGDFEVELFLSTDGKHTIHVKTDAQNAKNAIASAMNTYDYVLARYGTKQAQAVKEYGNGKSEMQQFDEKQAKQENCSHTNVRFSQSKTDKNPGRWFKACKECGKFLGWQS